MLKTSISGRFLVVLRHLNADGQADAARHFQVSQSAISKFESGEIGMAWKHLPELREYAVEACRLILKRVGLRIDDHSAYNRRDSELTVFDSAESDE
jgi:hypothetical protein